MNYAEIENLENMVVSDETPEISNFHKLMISEYIEKDKRKARAKENPFVYFYEDVISTSLVLNFETILGEHSYKNSSDDALSCINICDEFHKLSTHTVYSWLQNALKFTDNIVLHYIQEYCKEIPQKYQSTGVEKARYVQISEKEGDISQAGAELKELYDLRNGLEHRTITYPDGKQELVSPKRNKVRHIVAKLYPDALRRILKTYKSIY